MKELTPKRTADSRVEQIQIVLSSHINGARRLFDGRLMEWIDIVAGVVARRHSNHNTTTASIDNLQFKEPVHSGNAIILFGKVTCVGKTPIEIRVDTYVEHLDGGRRLVSTAYFVMVALDESDHPTPVPPLMLESDEEGVDWKAGERRNELRRQRWVEQY